MRIVALSGSLRTGSSNTAVLRALAALGLAGLPPFNPDLDREGDVPPPAVQGFRALLATAQAFVISCPEYAHGVPGVFKNALDWVVSSGELGGKPIALVNPSPGGAYARRALVDTLTVMEARVLEETSAQPQAGGSRMVGADGRVVAPEALARLRAGLTALLTAAATAPEAAGAT
jgi:NAD(P)H-dependent FMN reductase